MRVLGLANIELGLLVLVIGVLTHRVVAVLYFGFDLGAPLVRHVIVQCIRDVKAVLQVPLVAREVR
jgi:hypothetical protein